ncbi:MAG: hypothetical protein JSV17_17045 [Candidatus Aminicenantes bacterium]|nr:MAG: hypothetical protein JSV17_17045 [Candidatus Aminicenantes bacterium]
MAGRAYDFTLNGGEDYHLLFSVPEKKKGALSGLKKKFDLVVIGSMIEQKGICVVDRHGRRKKLQPKPWCHF